MRISRLLSIEKTVKRILEESELAREDDCYLIFKVVEDLFPEEQGKSFADVMQGLKYKGISFESITRARRKIQSKCPWLRNEKVAEKRNEEQEVYKEYSRKG